MGVATGLSEAPYPKMPLWNVICLSYTSYFGHLASGLRMAWLWLVLVATGTGFADWQQWSWFVGSIETMRFTPPPTALPWALMAASGLSTALLVLAGVSIAVAWHRLMILNEQPGFSGSNLASGTLWRYILVGVVLCLIMLLPMLLTFPAVRLLLPRITASGQMPAPWFISLAVSFLAYGVSLAMVTRLCLLLPARAVGHYGLTFKEVWLRTQGNIWRLFWGVVLTTWPPVLLAELVFAATVRFDHLGGFPDQRLVMEMTVAGTVMKLYYLLALPISIGFLSHAYRHFFTGPLQAAE